MPLSLSPDLNLRIKGLDRLRALLTAAGCCYFTDNNAQSLVQSPSGHFVPACRNNAKSVGRFPQ